MGPRQWTLGHRRPNEVLVAPPVGLERRHRHRVVAPGRVCRRELCPGRTCRVARDGSALARRQHPVVSRTRWPVAPFGFHHDPRAQPKTRTDDRGIGPGAPTHLWGGHNYPPHPFRISSGHRTVCDSITRGPSHVCGGPKSRCRAPVGKCLWCSRHNLGTNHQIPKCD